MRLPAAMLARSGLLPTRQGWVFEPTWDGSRRLARTGNDFQARSRRGWSIGS